MSPQAKRDAVRHIVAQHKMSERRACGLTIANRMMVRYDPKRREDRIKSRLNELAKKHISFGYRRLHALLKKEGHEVNHKKVYRLYKENKLMKRTRKRKRIMKKARKSISEPTRPNELWAMDFMSDSYGSGGKLRTLNIIDVFSRECLTIRVSRSFPSSKVVRELERLAHEKGVPEAIRVDNGPEYTSEVLKKWAEVNQVVLDYTTPGKPTENGYIESFNGKFREECLKLHWFKNLGEAEEVIGNWQEEYNTLRPHSALGYLTPKEYLEKYERGVHMFTNRSQTYEHQLTRPSTSSKEAFELVDNLVREEDNFLKRMGVGNV